MIRRFRANDTGCSVLPGKTPKTNLGVVSISDRACAFGFRKSGADGRFRRGAPREKSSEKHEYRPGKRNVDKEYKKKITPARYLFKEIRDDPSRILMVTITYFTRKM